MLKQVVKIGLGLSLVATTLLAEVEKKDLKIGFIAQSVSAINPKIGRAHV